MLYVYDSILLQKQTLPEMHLNLLFVIYDEKGNIGIAQLRLSFT